MRRAPKERAACRGSKGGFTLLELVFAVVVLSGILGGVLALFVEGADRMREAAATSTALGLARELMEEIRAQAFEEPGTTGTFGREAGERPPARTAFDDVDDYDGYGAYQPPRDPDGAALAGFAAFARSATVENVSNADFGRVVADGSSDFKRILVRVTTGPPLSVDVRLQTIVGRR